MVIANISWWSYWTWKTFKGSKCPVGDLFDSLIGYWRKLSGMTTWRYNVLMTMSSQGLGDQWACCCVCSSAALALLWFGTSSQPFLYRIQDTIIHWVINASGISSNVMRLGACLQQSFEALVGCEWSRFGLSHKFLLWSWHHNAPDHPLT